MIWHRDYMKLLCFLQAQFQVRETPFRAPPSLTKKNKTPLVHQIAYIIHIEKIYLWAKLKKLYRTIKKQMLQIKGSKTDCYFEIWIIHAHAHKCTDIHAKNTHIKYGWFRFFSLEKSISKVFGRIKLHKKDLEIYFFT